MVMSLRCLLQRMHQLHGWKIKIVPKNVGCRMLATSSLLKQNVDDGKSVVKNESETQNSSLPFGEQKEHVTVSAYMFGAHLPPERLPYQIVFDLLDEQNKSNGLIFEIPGELRPPSKTFKWDNRTKLATMMMVGWFAICAALMLKKNMDKKEQHHKIMLQQSLQYMSDEDKAKMEAVFRSAEESKK